MHGISLHDGNCHLVNACELYTCFFSVSCFHPVTLDVTATEDLTNLSPAPENGAVHLGALSVGNSTADENFEISYIRKMGLG